MTNYVRNGTTGDDVIQDANWTVNDFVKSELFAGNDVYIGWGASYLVYGGAGNDSISSGWSGGTAYGGAGDDRLTLQATGNDHIGYGGDGNDFFFVWYNNGGSLSCFGGGGIDRFDDLHAGSPDLFDGGSGFDYVLDGNSSEGITVSLVAGSGSGGAAALNTYVSIEGLSASAHADSLTGDGEKNTLVGENGADTLQGGAEDDLLIGMNFSNFFPQFTKAPNAFSYTDHGSMNRDSSEDDGAADILIGGAGDDVLIGGLGSDTLNGGADFDLANYVDSDNGITVNLFSGATAGDSALGDKFIQIEGVLGGGFDDILTGNGGANLLRGRTGNDALNGGKGADTLQGEDGLDTLDGGAGVDTMSGGAHDDTYKVDSASDVVKEVLSGGIDTVLTTATHTLAFAVDHLTLIGGGAINGTGNTLANAITGNLRANEIDGQGGNDTLDGGAGVDRFVFSTKLNGATNVDRVLSYNIAADTIILKQTAFAGLVAGGLDADAFVLGATAQDNEDRVLYDQFSGALLFDADGAKTKFIAVQFATLDVSLPMTNGEFLIIA